MENELNLKGTASEAAETDIKKNIFRNIFKNSAMGMILTGKAGELVEANDYICRVLGYTHEELMQLSVKEITHPEDVSSSFRIIQRLGRGEISTARLEKRYLTKKGKVVWANVFVSLFSIDDSTEKFILAQIQDITKQKEAEFQLKKERQYFSDVIEAAKVGSFECNLETGSVLHNKQWLEMFGHYSQRDDELVLGDWWNMLHPDDVSLSKTELEKCLKNEIDFYTCEVRVKHRDGNWVWVSERGNVTRRDAKGKPLMVSGTCIDITQKKEAEFELRSTHRLLSLILESTTDGIYVADKELNYTFWNKSMEKISGFSSEEVVGKKMIDLFPFLKEAGLWALMEKAVEGKTMHSHVYKYEIPEKNIYGWAQDTYVPLKDEDGSIVGVLGKVSDVTEMKSAEFKIKEKDEILRRISEQVPGMIYQFQFFEDGSYCFPYASSGIYGVYEVYPEEVEEDASMVMDRVHSEDRQMVYDSIIESFRTLEYWQCDYRVELPQKGLRWLSGCAKPERNSDGSVTWHGYINDITERKKVEERLKTLSTVASQTTNAVLILDKEHKVEWLNSGFTKIFGYSLEDVKGLKPSSFLINKGEVEAELDAIEKGFEALTPFYQEIKCMNKNGDTLWVEVYVSPVTDADGKAVRFVSVQNDITERIIKDLELKESLKLSSRQNERLQNFAHIVSHNLRSHAANIQGLLMMLETSDEGDKSTYTDLLKTSSQNLLDTLAGLNEIVQIQQDDDLPRENISLNQLIDKIFGSLSRAILENNVTIELDIPPDFILYTNSSYLESILFNLVTNAIKYKSDSNKPIIRISASTSENGTAINIKDNGLGMDMHKVKNKIFGMNKTFHNHPESRGLGLFITKHQVQALGGEIFVQSTPGVGSTFSIIFGS